MDPVRFLHWEMIGFGWLFCALLAHRMLTRQINLDGLLRDERDARHVSPERVQLLISTIAVSVKLLQSVRHTGVLPELSPEWLGFFGASGGVYAAVKGFKAFRGKQAQQALDVLGRL